ncbi:HK97 family phage prohead protease, partial [Microbacterium allomyrinae]
MTGIRLGMQPLRTTIFVPTVTVDPSARTITGTITLFGIPSTDGRIIEAGALTPRDPLSRVKLLVDHDHAQPVGYMTALEIDDEKAGATFYVPEGAAGDRALADAKAGLRDGLSVGFAAAAGGYFWDEEDQLHYTAGELYETSLCAIPAFQDAQVEEVAAALAAKPRKDTRMNREQLAAALAAGQITQVQHDAALAALNAVEAAARPAAPAPVAPAAGTPGEPVPAEYAAGPQGAPAPLGRTEDRPASFQTVAADIAEAARRQDRAGILEAVNLALGEVGVADDAGNAFIGRPEWIGEVWQARTEGRPWIDSLGGVQPLTGTKVEGFRWARADEYTETGTDKEARVKPYAGNFAEVATGKRKTIKVEEDSERWGVGSKVDRIYTDLGSPDLIASLFGLLGADFDADSDAHVRSVIVEAAQAEMTIGETPTQIVDATLVKALTRTALRLKRIGATLAQVWVAEDLFEDFSELTVAQLPAWLANSIGFVDLSDGTAQVTSKLKVDVDFGLDSGE